MIKFIPIYKEGVLYLRRKNPLETTRNIVSQDAYAEHERQYRDEAIIFLTDQEVSNIYDEDDLIPGWQFNENDNWIDCSEPAFIGTHPGDYRQVFRSRIVKQKLPYQVEVLNHLVNVFGLDVVHNKQERVHRFIEEALELAQSLGCPKDDIYRLCTYVFSRPPGEPYQEVGGVMVTLAALCEVNEINLLQNGEIELQRISTPEIIDKMRSKQATKMEGSPLPGVVL